MPALPSCARDAWYATSTSRGASSVAELASRKSSMSTPASRTVAGSRAPCLTGAECGEQAVLYRATATAMVSNTDRSAGAARRRGSAAAWPPPRDVVDAGLPRTHRRRYGTAAPVQECPDQRAHEQRSPPARSTNNSTSVDGGSSASSPRARPVRPRSRYRPFVHQQAGPAKKPGAHRVRRYFFAAARQQEEDSAVAEAAHQVQQHGGVRARCSLQVVDGEQHRLLPGQPVEQPAHRLEQPRPFHSCVAERRRRWQVEALEEPPQVWQSLDQPGPRARLDGAHEPAVTPPRRRRSGGPHAAARRPRAESGRPRARPSVRPSSTTRDFPTPASPTSDTTWATPSAAPSSTPETAARLAPPARQAVPVATAQPENPLSSPIIRRAERVVQPYPTTAP